MLFDPFITQNPTLTQPIRLQHCRSSTSLSLHQELSRMRLFGSFMAYVWELFGPHMLMTLRRIVSTMKIRIVTKFPIIN